MKCTSCEKNKPEEQFHRNFATCIECGKTGTIPPPLKPAEPFGEHYVLGRLVKAKKMCEESKCDVVLYHDERGHLSMHAVNDIATIHVSRNMLTGFKLVNGKAKAVSLSMN
jgi:hypothetical protein